jgi:hypothetical protein
MTRDYVVAIVAQDGHTEYGPFQIPALNALNAIEIAFEFHSFPVIPGCKIAVQLPNSNIALALDYGNVGY